MKIYCTVQQGCIFSIYVTAKSAGMFPNERPVQELCKALRDGRVVQRRDVHYSTDVYWDWIALVRDLGRQWSCVVPQGGLPHHTPNPPLSKEEVYKTWTYLGLCGCLYHTLLNKMTVSANHTSTHLNKFSIFIILPLNAHRIQC